MEAVLVPCSEMQGTLSGVGRCDRGVSTFDGAFRSGLAPCGRDCRIVGRGNGRGQPSVGKAREVPGKKMVMGKEASCAKLCKLQKYREALFSRFRPTTKTTKTSKTSKTPLCRLPCSAPVEPHAQE